MEADDKIHPKPLRSEGARAHGKDPETCASQQGLGWLVSDSCMHSYDAFASISGDRYVKGPKYVRFMIRHYRKRPLRDRFLYLRCLLRAVDTQSIFDSVDGGLRDGLRREVLHAERLVQRKLKQLQSRIASHLWRPDSAIMNANMHAMLTLLQKG